MIYAHFGRKKSANHWLLLVVHVGGESSYGPGMDSIRRNIHQQPMAEGGSNEVANHLANSKNHSST